MSARERRKRVLDLFEGGQNALIYLRGGSPLNRYDTDYQYAFRQESNFLYLSGVDEPDYELLIELDGGAFHLLAPKRPRRHAVWDGKIPTAAGIRQMYDPDQLHIGKKAADLISSIGVECVYCLDEAQAGALEGLSPKIRIDTEALRDALAGARLVKTKEELDEMRHAAAINNLAHRELLKAVRPGMFEYECKAIFEYHQVRNGLVRDAFNGIFASGPNSAILHYNGWRRQLNEGELLLVDAGYESNGYASDVTRTWPVGGVYTPHRRAIYGIVLEAQRSAIEKAAPGVRMEELHLLSARIILEGLREERLIKGEVDDLMQENIFALFFPHGLGHFLGLDTHDVGGYPKGVDRIDRPGLRHLRARRELASGMVITIEPGIYFIPALLGPALRDRKKSPFLNGDRIEPLLDIGGVRIEDNLVLREGGCENLTDVPKEIREIEGLMKG